MSEIGTSEGASVEAEKPVHAIDEVKFPPYPEPTNKDFEEDVSEEERSYYKNKFPDLNAIVSEKLHCTACDRHLGCSAKNEPRMRPHPMLRTLICHTCHSFYNSGEFDKGEDGSELYCRWCGQGGQVYCCSDCVHVFCAKCIKRNLGVAKIKEIENMDDWKCFKCNPKSLWDLRALCWALLRFCDFRNKTLFHTEDVELKEKYQKAIAIDNSECCKHKIRRRERIDSAKKKEKEVVDVKKIIPKLPPTIQVKKFALMNTEDSPKYEKKPVKRPASPKTPKMGPGYIQKPISIAPCALTTPPILKKVRLPSAPLLNPVRFSNDKKMSVSYNRIPIHRPRQPFALPIASTPYNGMQSPFSVNLPSLMSDNINLSLETLTQGLDMAAVAAFNNTPMDNDVVCTPDFPMEPLCEVMDDNDDDVECITPGPVVPPKMSNPPPLVPRSLPDLSSENIVQMTDNDVTVNTITGGLKFRVDPQTLSSKKMYRLPDGRIFAINPNPNMPGGYSATIVSVSDSTGKVAPKGGETFAAKLSAIAPSPTPSRSNSKNLRSSSRKPKAKSTPRSKGHKTKETSRESKETSRETRDCDFKVPIEWYRYNLIDAVDALDYSLSRLNKLKKEATTSHLRTRTVDEIKYLHRTLEQLLTTSSKRFLEIRESLNKELKQYVSKKSSINTGDVTEDDDDVEFLPNAGNDDPIFIDENSVDSVNGNESQEVDLTGVASSELNDSTDNKNDSDPLLCNERLTVDDKDATVNSSDSPNETLSPSMCDLFAKEHDKDTPNDKVDGNVTAKRDSELNDIEDTEIGDKQDAESHDKLDDKSDKQVADSNERIDELNKPANTDKPDADTDKQDADTDKEDAELEDKKYANKHDGENGNEGKDKNIKPEPDSCGSIRPDQKTSEINGEILKENHKDVEDMDVDSNDQSGDIKAEPDDDKTQDAACMSKEMIENLLKDDTLDVNDSVSNTNSLNITE